MLCDWAIPTTIGSNASVRDELTKIHQKLSVLRFIYVICPKALNEKIKKLEIKYIQSSSHS
jgi:hypothetical protein